MQCTRNASALSCRKTTVRLSHDAPCVPLWQRQVDPRRPPRLVSLDIPVTVSHALSVTARACRCCCKVVIVGSCSQARIGVVSAGHVSARTSCATLATVFAACFLGLSGVACAFRPGDSLLVSTQPVVIGIGEEVVSASLTVGLLLTADHVSIASARSSGDSSHPSSACAHKPLVTLPCNPLNAQRLYLMAAALPQQLLFL